jgi:uncharacterized protein (TIGR01777 family)
MKILVTGATGLIGSALCKHLRTTGHSIHVLTTRPAWQLKDNQIQVFRWSPEKQQIDEAALVGIDAIINLAGAKIDQRWTTAAKQSIMQSRSMSTRLLFEAVKRSKKQVHFICASAIGIYPSDLTAKYVETESKISTGFAGKVAHLWEKEARQFESLSCRVTILRIGLVLSNAGGAFVPLSRPVRWGVGAWFGNGKQWQSWIHIDDLIQMIDYCLINKLEGCFNATAPNPVQQRTLIKTIAKRLRVPQFLPGIPKFVMAFALGEMHQVLYESVWASPKNVLDQRFSFQFPDISSCVYDLLKPK